MTLVRTRAGRRMSGMSGYNCLNNNDPLASSLASRCPQFKNVKSDRSDLLLSYITVTRHQSSTYPFSADCRPVSEISAWKSRLVISPAHPKNKSRAKCDSPLSICLVSNALRIVTVTHLGQDVLPNLFDSFPGIINVTLLCPGGPNSHPDTEHSAQ